MSADPPRQLRADAARNAELLVSAAHEVFAELGVDASLDDVARRAGVGIATLYRRFPRKEDLVRAVLERAFAEKLGPEIERALREPDARRAITIVVEAALTGMASERNTLAAASVVTAEIIARFLDPLAILVHRGQAAGLVRDDLVPEDLLRIVLMLSAVLWTVDPAGDGWRRYVTLVLDSIGPVAATALPPAEPLPSVLSMRHWSV